MNWSYGTLESLSLKDEAAPFKVSDMDVRRGRKGFSGENDNASPKSRDKEREARDSGEA